MSLKKSANKVLKVLLKELNTNFTENTLDSLNNHPYFPDLVSVSHILAKLKINNITLKINYNQLLEAPKPCIIHLKDNGGEYVIVKSIIKDSITVITERNIARNSW